MLKDKHNIFIDGQGRTKGIHTDTEGQKLNENKIMFLGYMFDAITQSQTIDNIEKLIQDNKLDNSPKYVSTVNLDFLTQSIGFGKGFSNIELDRCLKQSDMVVADGMPIVWLSKLFGIPLPERVTGADLLPQLCQHSNDKGWKLYFVGGSEDTLDLQKNKLKQQYPNVNIVGMEAPFIDINNPTSYINKKKDDEILDRVNSSGADILVLCLGCPKQELFFDRIKNKLKVPVTIGLGASLNFITGNNKRAPVMLQKLGLEWCHRLFYDPSRLCKRYLKDILFLLRILLCIFRTTGLFNKQRRPWKIKTLLVDNKEKDIIQFPNVCDNIPTNIEKKLNNNSLISLSYTTHMSLSVISQLSLLILSNKIKIRSINDCLLRKLMTLNIGYYFYPISQK